MKYSDSKNNMSNIVMKKLTLNNSNNRYSVTKKLSDKIMNSLLVKKKRNNAILSLIVGLMVLIPSVIEAQSVVGYNYINRIGGNIVTTQTSLTVQPGQEVEYIIEVYNVSASTPFARTIKIAVPYFADYHSATPSTGTVNFISGDTIEWNTGNLNTAQGTITPAATLTYTLVASTDCYALNTVCTKDITVIGSLWNAGIVQASSINYGYYGGAFSSTPTAVGLNSGAYVSANCTSVGLREYVYLENKTLGATVPTTDIADDFPIGAQFYDTINTTLGTPIGAPLSGFRVDTARKRTYFAHTSNNCWEKFYINVLDTSVLIFCEGEFLDKAVVWASDWDAFKNGMAGGKWLFGTANEEIDPLTRQLLFADSGKILKFIDTTYCTNTAVTSNLLKIIVHAIPVITLQLPPQQDYCVGTNLWAQIGVDKRDDSVKYEWTFGGNIISDSSVAIRNGLVASDSGKWLKVTITNTCGKVADSTFIRVHILPTVTIVSPPSIVCMNAGTAYPNYQFTGNPTDGTWKSLNPSVATVNSSGQVVGIAEGGTIIRYTYTNGYGCIDSADANITVNPTPLIGNKTATICGDSVFKVTPATGGGDIVPAGTTYTWTVSANSNITGASSGSGSQISQTLHNITDVPQTITYTVTPATSTCTGATFTITVTVNPTPYIQNTTATICSDSIFTVSPSTSGGDIVPTGTTYTWTVVSNPNITGASNQSSPQSNISQTLVNTTNTAQNITYTVTPMSSNGCPGVPFTIVVTVNPTPSIQNTTAAICSDSTFLVTPSTGGGNIVPATISYTWTVATNTNVTGQSNQTVGQPNISQTLKNLTNVAEHVIYTVTPLSGSCQGRTFTIDVTVDPTPFVRDTTAGICSDSTFSYTPQNGNGSIVPALTTYTWTVSSNPNITGASNQSSPVSSISQTLHSTVNTSQSVTYTVTPLSGGCKGLPFNIVVTVSPAPTVINTTATICSDSTFIVAPTNSGGNIVPVGTAYTWTVSTNTNLTGQANQPVPQSDIRQTLHNLTNVQQQITYTVTPSIGGGCPGSPFTIVVSVDPTPFVRDTTLTICNDSAFSLTPQNIGSNIVPASTNYTWTISTNTNISGASAQSSPQTSISQILRNLTNTPQTIT